jgi:MFS transporter, DHA1 family, multidrug resistance protein
LQTPFSFSIPFLSRILSQVLWQRNTNVLWIASFIAMIGMNACLPFLPLYVRVLGVTDFAEAQRWTGFVYSGAFVLSIFTVPLWGALGDKYGKKLMIVRAIFGLTLAMFLMGFAQNVWQLFFLRIFQGGVSGFIAASVALVSSTAPEHKRGYAISFLQTSISAGMVVGPLLGGVITDTFGVRNLFTIVAAFCFVSGLVVVAYVEEVPNPDAANSVTPGVLENIRFAWQTPLLREVLLCIVVVQAGLNFTPPIMAYFFEQKGAPAQFLATITGVSIGLVGVLTVIVAPRWGIMSDRRGFTWVMIRILPWLGLATVLQGFVPRYEWIFPLRVVIGIFAGAAIPTLYAALSKHSPNERNGGIIGLASSATLVGGLVAPILCGWIASTIGMTWCFVISGALFWSVFPRLYRLHKELPVPTYTSRQDSVIVPSFEEQTAP